MSFAKSLQYVRASVAAAALLVLSGCPFAPADSAAAKAGDEPKNARDVMFIGVDISGSFMRGKHYEDAMNFLAHYMYGHLNGHGNLEVPQSLFVGSIGGATPNEPKTFYPIQTFENKSIDEIKAKLAEIFPKKTENPFTDFNAFFTQIAEFVRNKNLVLRPITVVLLSDGKPDAPSKSGLKAYDALDLKPLETLARKITVRLLYTDAVVGMNWQTKVKRQRVRVWTQDAEVMSTWKDPKIFLPGTAFKDQARFFSWIKDNVDFPVRVRRVK